MKTQGDPNLNSKPWVVEFVGPAGTGKSSLAEALVNLPGKARLARPPYFRNMADWPFFGANLIHFLPVLSRMMLDPTRRNPSPRQVVWMLTLQGWHKQLQNVKEPEKVHLLDQGPVFIMTDLYRMRCINLQDRLVKAWWTGVIENWADTLAAVVLLDAPNKLLIERIRSRRKWHLMKDRKDVDLINFLEDYRLWFERVIAQISSQNRAFRVIRLNTGKMDLNTIMEKTADELGIPVYPEIQSFPENPGQALQNI